MSAFAAALGLRRAGTALAEPAELQQLLDSVSQPRVDSVVIKADWQSGGTGGKRQVGAADLDAASAAGSDAAQGQQQHTPPGLPAAAAGPRVSTPGAQAASTSSSSPHWLLTSVYGVTNLSSVVMIVVANKMVLYTHKFSFAITLTALHALFTAAGMAAMAAGGLFEHRKVPLVRSAPIAAVYVGFIVFNNLSIQLNTVGFYQLSKLAITPVLVAIEYFFYGKTASPRVLASIAVLLLGITLCTITDSQVASNPLGMLVAAAAVVVTSLYQVWAGTKQKELGLNGMQLLQQVSPVSVALLAVLIPLLEPVGWRDPRPGTILGFTPTAPALLWIGASSVLGLVVTLSTFLFIGATSSLTYNVVGHLKTVLIVAAGVGLFGDEISGKKLLGIGCAMGGIVWYSFIKLDEARKPPAK